MEKFSDFTADNAARADQDADGFFKRWFSTNLDESYRVKSPHEPVSASLFYPRAPHYLRVNFFERKSKFFSKTISPKASAGRVMPLENHGGLFAAASGDSPALPFTT